jgi:hypothetical protein
MPRLARFPSGSLAAALVVYRTWMRLPPKQRAQLVDAARAHGPRVAAAALAAAKARARGSRSGRAGKQDA